MEQDMDKLKEKLAYISKSKKQCLEACPLQFKFNYIEKRPQAPNPFFIIGNDVHSYIEKFFDIIDILDNGELTNLRSLVFHPNMGYKKNIARFEIMRYKKVFENGKDSTYFFPVINETKIITEKPKLIGIPDRVHKCMVDDAFAPKHPDFKDGDLVIVENKTGKPTAEKCKNYEGEFLWYKILIEITRPELGSLKWGAIYFPYDNHVHHCQISNDDCRILASEIKKAREEIMHRIDTGLWEAKPSYKSCMWCAYKADCPAKVVK